jgi:hypothetical protein
MVDGNVKIRTDGYRVCLTCLRETKARWERNKRRKEKGLPLEPAPARGQLPVRRVREGDDQI